jgi:hypothetical protein
MTCNKYDCELRDRFGTNRSGSIRFGSLRIDWELSDRFGSIDSDF